MSFHTVIIAFILEEIKLYVDYRWYTSKKHHIWLGTGRHGFICWQLLVASFARMVAKLGFLLLEGLDIFQW